MLENKFTQKIVIGFIFLLCIIFLSQGDFSSDKDLNKIKEQAKEISLLKEFCFAYLGDKDNNNFYDKYTLRIYKEGDKATGELKFLPKYKDSKVGLFEGILDFTYLNDQIVLKEGSFVWDTFAEGLNAKEELHIYFNDNKAKIGLGEMVDKGDGSYIYKDKNLVNYNSLILPMTSCFDLNEIEGIEYALKNKNNYKFLSEPVLGGSWFLVNFNLDIINNKGIAVYEDGHIQETKEFVYETDYKGFISSFEFLE